MRAFIAFLIIMTFTFSIKAQTGKSNIHIPDSTKKIQIVETSCGKCNFGMKSDDCSLAVRIKGRSYFVDGTGIDEYGDAHSKNGFCNAIRKAEVQGEIKGNRFVATYFKLIENSSPKKKMKKA